MHHNFNLEEQNSSSFVIYFRFPHFVFVFNYHLGTACSLANRAENVAVNRLGSEGAEKSVMMHEEHGITSRQHEDKGH